MNTISRIPLIADAAAARAIACIIERHWPEQPVQPLPANRLPDALAPHYRWSIGAVVEQGGPPTFGQLPTCNPVQRCPGCTTGCNTESLVEDIHRRTGSDVILLVMGGSCADPAWIRTEIMIVGAPRLSGVSIPILDSNGVLSFVYPSCGFIFTPYRHGGATQKKSFLPADLDQMALVFQETMLWIRRDILALDKSQSKAKGS